MTKLKQMHSMAIICLSIMGFLAGHFHRVTKMKRSAGLERRISSLEGQSSVNNYKNLACPSEEEYRSLANRVKLQVPEKIKICADENHGRLAKLLSFASNLQFHFPSNWAPELQADMRDPLSYIARMTNKMEFEFSQTTSIAQNKKSEKLIQLGGMFFDEEPLDALSVLVHEARHSSTSDPGHTTCLLGDIPHADGGCDRELSIQESRAGAYSYGTAFAAALGLYADGLSNADRELMLSTSLVQIGTRFNILPTELAQSFDLLTVLDSEGTVFLLHPFSKKLIPFDIPFLKNNEKVIRLEADIRSNGLLFFTNKDHLYSWSSKAGFERVYADQISEDWPIFHAARTRIPYEDYPYYQFLSDKNQIYYYHFDTLQKKFVLSEYPIRGAADSKELLMPSWKIFFLGLYNESIFLDQGGSFYLGAKFGGDAPFTRREDLQLKGRTWVYGNGGVVYESLYSIASDGRVYQTRVTFKDSSASDDSMYMEPIYHLQEARLQAGVGLRALKFLEGANYKVLLDDQSFIHFEFYQKNKQRVWGQLQGKKIIDMALFRKHHVTKEILPISYVDTRFVNQCRIIKPIDDPWFSRGMGLDEAGHFVVAGSESEPCTYPLGEKAFSALHWSFEKIKNGDSEEEAYSFSQGKMQLIDNAGGIAELEPYGMN